MNRQRTPGIRRRVALVALVAMVQLLAGVWEPAALAVAQETLPARSRYEIDATLDPTLGAINATLALDWQNTTGMPQDALYFRLYPNAGYYGDGALTVLEVAADGVPVTPVIAADPTVLEVPLPATVPAGGNIAVRVVFQTVVPTEAPDSLGILQRDARDIWSLADWYPIVAGYEPSEGWYLDAPTIFGDPTFSETADYVVRLAVPAGYTVLGSGTARPATGPDGTVQVHIDAPLSREFAMTVLPGEMGNELVARTAEAGSTAISLVLPREVVVPGLADLLLDTATAAFPVYEGWLGEYPGETLDLTIADLGGASGVSWAGTVWMDLWPFVADGTLSEIERIRLRFLVVHEVGHQWIGNVIGANTNDHQFLGEGLTNALTVAVFREIDGPDTAERYLRADVAGAYVALLKDGRDGIADVPVSNDLNGVLHSIMVYGKAALGFEAIRQEIGDEAFFAALARYGETFRFDIATPADLQAAFERTSGRDLDALWTFWFAAADATVDDAEAVLDGYAAS